jgi:hypothetical protein
MDKPTHPPALSGSKTLWAATLVLLVVVLAMGAALIRIQSRPIEPRLVWVGQHAQTPAAQTAASATASAPIAAENHEKNMAPAHTDKAHQAINNEASTITAKPRPVLPRQPEPAVARPPELGSSDTASPPASQALPR